jgi:hypothetical protein
MAVRSHGAAGPAALAVQVATPSPPRSRRPRRLGRDALAAQVAPPSRPGRAALAAQV